jgi:adenylate kinase family enzyme
LFAENKTPQKIAIIGNAGAGKTTLGRKLSQKMSLPLTPVDSIQFLSGMKIRPRAESIQMLTEIQAGERWIIDGYGPLDILEKRLQAADQIILLDWPLWQNYFWATKRQIKSLWSPRAELPADCREATWSQTMKLYKTIGRVHNQMRPELLRILQRENLRDKVIRVKTRGDLKKLMKA